MRWPFGKKQDDAMSVDALLARANTASPTGGTAPAAAAVPGVPTVAPDGAFRMTVADVFSITGRGTVVTGQVEAGTVSTGMTVHVVRGDSVIHTVEVTGVEAFRKKLDSATVGANVGVLLAGVTRDDVHSGDVLTG